jgi:hypothetical protein
MMRKTLFGLMPIHSLYIPLISRIGAMPTPGGMTLP